MGAQAATSDQHPTERHDAALASLPRVVLITATAMMLLLTAWLCGRRLAGELASPLGGWHLSAAGVVMLAVVSALRWGWWRTGTPPPHAGLVPATLWLLPSLAVLGLAVALSIRGTSPAALGWLWGLLVMHESAWGYGGWRLRQADATRPLRGASPPADVPAARDVVSGRERRGLAQETGEETDLSLSDDVSQQITRAYCAERGDTITGVLRAPFRSGERTRHLHVAFCPPLPGRPSVDVAQISGPRARVKAADVQAFGIRFDLRLLTPSPRHEQVLIHFEARYQA
jgi:hypothetical protein